MWQPGTHLEQRHGFLEQANQNWWDEMHLVGMKRKRGK
jgi:hypothetical protein